MMLATDQSLWSCPTINKDCAALVGSFFSLQVDPRWQLVRDSENRLRMKRQLRTKNFVKVGVCVWQQVSSWLRQLALEEWGCVFCKHVQPGLFCKVFDVRAPAAAVLSLCLLLSFLLLLLLQALALFEQVGQVAEEEKHHPDLHLEVRLRDIAVARQQHACAQLSQGSCHAWWANSIDVRLHWIMLYTCLVPDEAR